MKNETEHHIERKTRIDINVVRLRENLVMIALFAMILNRMTATIKHNGRCECSAM